MNDLKEIKEFKCTSFSKYLLFLLLIISVLASVFTILYTWEMEAIAYKSMAVIPIILGFISFSLLQRYFVNVYEFGGPKVIVKELFYTCIFTKEDIEKTYEKNSSMFIVELNGGKSFHIPKGYNNYQLLKDKLQNL